MDLRIGDCPISSLRLRFSEVEGPFLWWQGWHFNHNLFSANTKIWLDLILSIVEIKVGLHRYIITLLRLSIWLSISQYESRLRIIEARSLAGTAALALLPYGPTLSLPWRLPWGLTASTRGKYSVFISWLLTQEQWEQWAKSSKKRPKSRNNGKNGKKI